MRIVVNDIAASKTGALSVLKDFYKYVLEHDKENEWIFVLGDKLLEERDNIRIVVRSDVKAGWLNRLKFDLINGGKYLMSFEPDVVFSLQNTMPASVLVKKVLYVHQPLGFQRQKNFSLFKGAERHLAIYQHFISRLIDASIKKADKTIVQTKWMEDAITKKTGVKPEKIRRILPDINVPRLERILSDNKFEALSEKDFFYPASNIIYKNHSCIMEAVKLLKERNVSGFSVSFTLEKTDACDFPYYDKFNEVHYLGSIDRDEVFLRYKKGTLLFPSYIETFGYPPAEARAVKGLVLASDCDFSREVLNEYDNAYYFNPFDPVELADCMEKVIKGDIVNKYKDYCVADNTDTCSTAVSWEQVVEEIISG